LREGRVGLMGFVRMLRLSENEEIRRENLCEINGNGMEK
jgi:hypothetical protein